MKSRASIAQIPSAHAQSRRIRERLNGTLISNRIEGGCKGTWSRTIALRMVSSLRVQAVRAMVLPLLGTRRVDHTHKLPGALLYCPLHKYNIGARQQI